MKIYKGEIVSCDEKHNVYQYLVEDQGKIIFTGNMLPDEYKNLPITDLGKKALLPTFTDTHIHFSSYAYFEGTPSLRDCRNNEEIGAKIAAHLRETGESFFLGFGISGHNVAEKHIITREELDRHVPDIPVMVIQYDGHASVVNSAMLKNISKKISHLRGYHPDSGLLEQEVYFAGSSYMTGKVSPFELTNRILRAFDQIASKGIGMIHAVEGVGFPMDLDIDLMRIIGRGLKNPINLRIYFQTMDIRKALKRKMPRIGGCFEAATDGSFGSLDAALHHPYEQGPANNCGILFKSDEQVNRFAMEANRAGLQIEMHAIGDAAIDQAVNALDLALKENPRDDHRHTIIHGFLPSEEALEKMARNNIYVALQPGLIDDPLEPAAWHKKILGKRSQKLSPLKTYAKMGITMTGGSDAPVSLPDPIDGIHHACNHPVHSQSLTIPEALHLFTLNAAKGSFDEKKRGSLEVGKVADMIIVNQNPLKMKTNEIRNLKVEQTLLAGKPYQPGQGLGELVLKQLFPTGRL